jgi:hypothetical protein
MNREIAVAVGIALSGFGAGHYAGEEPHALASAVTVSRRDDGDQQLAVQDGPENEIHMEATLAPLPAGPVPAPFVRTPWQFWDEATHVHAHAGAAMMQMQMLRNGALDRPMVQSPGAS